MIEVPSKPQVIKCNPRSTTLEASTLTIAPSMRLKSTVWKELLNIYNFIHSKHFLDSFRVSLKIWTGIPFLCYHLFSPWYSWKIAELALNNNHSLSLTHTVLPLLSEGKLSLSPKWCVLTGEVTNTNFTVFGLTRPGLEPTIYRF
jgi:hypothetical protein